MTDAFPSDVAPGHTLVHARQGMASVEAVETRDIDGEDTVFLRLRNESGHQLLLPRDHAAALGWRRLAVPVGVDILGTLRATSTPDPVTIRPQQLWSWPVEGDAAQLCRALRALAALRSRTPPDQVAFDIAMQRVASAVAHDLGVDLDAAWDRVMEVLRSSS